MLRTFLAAACALSIGSASAADEAKPQSGSPLNLTLRKRVETKPGSGRFHALTEPETWNPKQTAVIVCDMWDLHHCLNATRRGAELAPRMDAVLKSLRERGVTVIHAPSSCMEAYRDHPARKRAAAVAKSKSLPEDIGKWCHRIPEEEQGTYPIDQTDGGEDDDPQEHKEWAAKLAGMGRNPRAPWKSQTGLLTIRDEDFISDSGEEIWSLLEERGISNVILLGVHTNMCVLGRPFGLRQMAKNGKRVVLMRDMTDTMYNPARAPFVSHFTGTDLIVEHIEKWVCPTITSDQVLGGKPFRFAFDARPRLAVIVAEDEYRTEQTLPPFALKSLGHDFAVTFVFGSESERNDVPGLGALDEADVALISVRRRVLPKDQLDRIRAFVAAGKPVVGIRTASHAFAPAGTAAVPDGHDAWLRFDPEVLGGNYRGHHGNDVKSAIRVAEGGERHPLLAGLDVSKLEGNGSLYRVSPLEPSATALLIGTIPGKDPEPVAWTNELPGGNRVFYTSLGHKDDFENPEFCKLLRNGLKWAAEPRPRSGS